MPTTLNSGLQLPDKGSVDWYGSMQTNYNLLDNHLENTDIHVTAEDKANWNSKQGSLSQAQLDAIAQVATNTSDIATLQSGKANASHTHSSSDITDIGDYATKQYVDNSISGLVDSAPNALDTLNELAAALNDDANFASTVATALSAKANSADLATVATSGSYNDLSNKPTINDSTITIQKNGSLVGTFTVNGSAKTIDIPVPTKTSDLTNDSNFVDTSNSAVASGITAAKVTSYDSHVADTDIHVTTADKSKWDNGVTQSYVFRYSGTAVVPNSTIAYSTIDNTDNIKSGDKILDVDGKLFEITAVDTTNQTVTVGTALIDLALDANVVHTNRNDDVSIPLNSTSAELGVTGGSTNITFLDKNDKKLSGVTLGNYASSKLSYVRLSIFDKDVNDNEIQDTLEYAYVSNNNNAYLRVNRDNFCALGTPSYRWKGVYAINYYYGANNVEFSTKFVTTDTNQTISGAKTFSNDLSVYNANSANTPIIIGKSSVSVRDSTNTNGDNLRLIFCDKNNNTVSYIRQRKLTNGNTDISFNVYNTDANNQLIEAVLNFVLDSSNNPRLSPGVDNTISLGVPTFKYRDINTYKINGLTPSSLGMPSDRSARVDISGYITNLGNGSNNSYTVPANGYIWLHFTSINSAVCFSQTSGGLTNYAQVFVRYSGDGLLYAFFPVRNGDNFIVQIYTSSTAVVQNAYFIPCQGNI